MPFETLYDTNQAARQLRVDPTTLRRWAEKRRVEHCRIGRRIYFTREQLDQAIRVVPARQETAK